MFFGIVFTNGCKLSINKQGLKKCVQKGLKKSDYIVYTYGYEHNDSTQKGLKDKAI